MANEKNLMPIQEVNSRRSREKHSEDSRKGGIASGESKRKRKLIKEQAELLLSLPIKNKKTSKKLDSLGIDKLDQNYQMALLLSILQKGIKIGDKSVAEFFRDTIEGKPKETLSVKGEINNPFENLTEEELRKLAGDG